MGRGQVSCRLSGPDVSSTRMTLTASHQPAHPPSPWRRAASVALAATFVCVAIGLLWRPEGKFAREWRHYKILRAHDAASPAPRPLRLDYTHALEVKERGSTGRYVAELAAGGAGRDAFAEGDALLIHGRLADDRASVCASLVPFERSLADAPDDLARAVVHETLFAVGRECGTPRPADLAAAAGLWQAMGVAWRADDERHVLDGVPLAAKLAPLEDPPARAAAPAGATTVTFGRASIPLSGTTRLGAQAERVSRDWLSGKLAAPWRRDPTIDYFEGALVNDVARAAAAVPVLLYGALVHKIGAHWYAPDENGQFRFLVLSDKVEDYPTTRFLADDLAVLVDAHGVSALAALAFEQHVDVVVGCCDYFDKILAAEHLAAHGIAVACPADRFLGYALGDRLPSAIVGGAPPHQDGGRTWLGGAPVTMRIAEPIVVEDTDEPYPWQYADAPFRYFTLLGERAGLHFALTTVQRRRGLPALLDVARGRGAAIVAVRVQSEDEAKALAAWLDQDPARRALLFHSAILPPGRRLLADYAGRVTVPDATPRFD